MTTPSAPGTLFVIATPIGNLEELSPRAIRILGEVNCIACEDTRHTRKLLTHFGISTPLTSYYREKEARKSATLLQQLKDGKSIALVSDAGTPGVSDPGAILVSSARQQGIPIVPISGPCALTVALSVAGLRDSRFFFAGFPPARKKARQDFFHDLAHLPWPLFFYESPHRIRACLSDALKIFGNRPAMFFRELTKLHEEIREGTLAELVDICQEKQKGEFVVMVQGADKSGNEQPGDLDELLRWHRDQGHSLAESVQEIKKIVNQGKTTIYRRALDVWQEK
jgi:16S rRNA (cytidine1402-2'-O)-methyltransferase